MDIIVLQLKFQQTGYKSCHTETLMEYFKVTRWMPRKYRKAAHPRGSVQNEEAEFTDVGHST